MVSATEEGKAAATIRLGFLGTGNLTSHLVARWCTATYPTTEPIVSPRNSRIAQQLSERYGAVVGKSNQDVVDQSDVVFICLPPAAAVDEMVSLDFDRTKVVLSAVAGLPHGQVEAVSAPATAVSIMMPGLPSRYGIGLTIAYPAVGGVATILDRFGTVLNCRDADEYAALAVFGGVSGCLFDLARHLGDGLAATGVDPSVARRLVAAAFSGIGGTLQADGTEAPSDLVSTVVSKGGMTEVGVRHLACRGNRDAWITAVSRMAAWRAPTSEHNQ